MGKLTLSSEIERLKAIPDFQGTNWSSIKPEFAARMAIQNQDCSVISQTPLY